LELIILEEDESDDDDMISSSSSNAKQVKAKWTRLQTTTSPPGRNAATLTCLPATSLPDAAIGMVEETDDPSSASTSTSSPQFYLLSGGWAPFQTTYNDNFVLKLTQEELE
jgi:hypothetical protein